MKGVSVLVAYVLVIVISVSAIALALNIGNPAIERSQEILILNEGKENLKIIDNAIDQVMAEGDGSSRELSVGVGGGRYIVEGNTITFEMTTNQQIIAPGVSGSEDDIYIEASEMMITAQITYPFDFVGEKEFGKGLNNLVIANQAGQIKIT